MDSLLEFFLQDFFCLLFQAELIDVSYGNADDLKRIQKMKNTTNKIALLKLGKLPLLYKVGPMAVAGGVNILFCFVEVTCLCE